MSGGDDDRDIPAFYLAFDSTHAAMAAKRLFGEEAAIIATPRGITADCGMTLKFTGTAIEVLRAHVDTQEEGFLQAKLYLQEEGADMYRLLAHL